MGESIFKSEKCGTTAGSCSDELKYGRGLEFIHVNVQVHLHIRLGP